MEQLNQDFEKLVEQLWNEKQNPALEQVIELRLNLKETIKQQESNYRNDVLGRFLELISDATEQIRILNQNNSHELSDVIELFGGETRRKLLQLQEVIDQSDGVSGSRTPDPTEIVEFEGVDIFVSTETSAGLVPRPMSECGAGKDAALQASVRTC